MTTIPSCALSDGASIPAVGFGTYPLTGSDAESAARDAIAAGYRLIDTAASYGKPPSAGVRWAGGAAFWPIPS